MSDQTESETIRRSVTVRPKLNLRLRDFMAACTRHGIDMDYTTAFNLFAELGARWLEESNREKRQGAKDVFSSYVDYSKLESSETLAYFREFEEFRQWKKAKERLPAKTA